MIARLYSEEVVLPTASGRYQIRVAPGSARTRGGWARYLLTVESEDGEREGTISVRPPSEEGDWRSRSSVRYLFSGVEFYAVLAEAFGEALIVAAGIARLLDEEAGL